MIKYKITYKHIGKGFLLPEGEVTKEFPDDVHYCVAFERMERQLPKCDVTGFWNLTKGRRIM